MRVKPLSTLLLVVAGFAACRKSDDVHQTGWCGTAEPAYGPGIAPGGCVQDSTACAGVTCTADFRSITLQATTSTGAPVVFDSFVVVDAGDTPLPAVNGVLPYGPTGTRGVYAILTDAWVQGHSNQTWSVRAKGFVGGVQVVDERAVITTDCCHVRSSAAAYTPIVDMH